MVVIIIASTKLSKWIHTEMFLAIFRHKNTSQNLKCSTYFARHAVDQDFSLGRPAGHTTSYSSTQSTCNLALEPLTFDNIIPSGNLPNLVNGTMGHRFYQLDRITPNINTR
jgi:hypothetical protein